MKKRVIVGMSGGVDSSVAAFLLKEQGYEVIGLFMKNWKEKEGGACTQEKDYKDVAKVADRLQIPHYAVDFSDEYRRLVFDEFLVGLKKGATPNPDILCNREIKFQVFLEKAKRLGGDYLATGHYARVIKKEGISHLGRGVDNTKDQSYFLYTLTAPILDKVLFPVGEIHKKDVRALAKKLDLATAEKKDSTGICFIGERNFQSFIRDYIATSKGPILTIDGKEMGMHEGLFLYTLGQRKGLGIGGAGEAWFVVDKKPKENSLIIAQGDSHPALYRDTLVAVDPSFVVPFEEHVSYECQAKIRYRQTDQTCVIEKKGNRVFVRFHTPQRAMTPAQAIVFYQGDFCLGGATIAELGPSHYEMANF